MPFPLGSEVLVAISDPHALARVREALRQAHTPFSEVSSWSLADRQPERVALIIYDLAPFDGTVLDRLERVRRAYPMVPFVLYPPPHVDAAQLLVDVAPLRLVHALLQSGSAAEVQRLRGAIRRAFLEAPSAGVLGAMEDMLGDGVDLKIKLFLAGVIRHVGPVESPPPSVQAMARSLNMSQRSLERVWSGTGLPGPKQMIDWATLATLAGAAAAVGETTSRLASRRGIGARRLHRLRRRLFGRKWPTIPKDPRSELEALLVKFGLACRNRRIRWQEQRELSASRTMKRRRDYLKASSYVRPAVISS